MSLKFIDLKEEFDEYLNDENRKIDKDHLETVCKIYKQQNTCRYIFLSSIGYICMKNSPMKKELDRLANNKKMSGISDNCRGLGENFEKKYF